MSSLVTTCSCGANIAYGPTDSYVYCWNCGRNFPAAPLTIYRTQKARGLYELNKLISLCGDGFGWLMKPRVALPRRVIQDEAGLKKAGNFFGPYASSPLFARPCPVTPRHGFVDSRVVKTYQELEQVWKETLAADPKGEVMLMDFLDPDFNMIYTPSLITLGRGHDGATAGKETINIPIMGGVFYDEDVDKNVFKAASIGEDQDPYIEAVGQFFGVVHPTQLRAGPKVGSSKADFIPTEVVVKELLTPNGMDLLEWEKLIQSKQGVEGVVVNNIGGSPIDHYSVHARTFNIPVITTRSVEVGETLLPIPTTPMSVESVLKGIVWGNEMELEGPSTKDSYRYQWERAINFSLFALHNSGAFEGEDGFWLGVGAAMLVRFGVTALKGEARHIKHPMPDREKVYTKGLKLTLNQLRAATPRNIHVLRYGDFGGNGVGGEKWALCGAATVKFINAIGNLAKERNQEALGEFIRTYNDTINQAHNGGWWLNKFTVQHSFDYACQNRRLFVLNIIPFALEVKQVALGEEYVEKEITRIASWRPLFPLPKVSLENATATFNFSTNSVAILVKDKVLKGQRKPLTIVSNEVVEKMLKGVNHSLFCVQDKDGTRLEVRNSDGVTVVYNDPPLEGSAFKKSA